MNLARIKDVEVGRFYGSGGVAEHRFLATGSMFDSRQVARPMILMAVSNNSMDLLEQST